MKKKILVIMLAIVMIMTFIPVLAMTASAAEAVTYVDRYWDEETKTVVSTTKSVSDYTVVTSGTSLYTGWCVVNSSVVFSDIVYFQDAYLILVDGVTLTAPKIAFSFAAESTTSSLTVYGQTSGTGKIILTPTDGCALKILENAHLIVNGGVIEATSGLYGAGIGDDNTSTKLGKLTVNGGTITAKGGEFGAGVGIGSKDLEKHLEITMNGGNVTAIGGKRAPGISTGIGATVTINGGIVKATGGERGAGIGSRASTQDGEDAGVIVINGGNITAKGGSYGAGIGSGGYDGDNGNTIINGGTVTATGIGGGAGIGGGWHGNGGTITISGGTVIATGSTGGAGIGSGSKENATVSITGGSITATGGQYSAGIGGGNRGNATVSITGGTITATGGQYGAGIGSGDGATGEGSVTISGGTIAATGGEEGAGVGSGRFGSSDVTIIITGGSIKATKGALAIDDVGAGSNSPANDPTSNGTTTVSLKTLTIQDVNEATAITSVNGLSGYSMKDVSTDADGKLYLYLPDDTSLPESITIGENKFYSDGTGMYTTHQHSFTYVASGATITATCQNTDGKCTNTNGGTAIIMTENATYTGSEIKNATVIYNDWVGAKDLEIIYENNTNAGTATASITVGGVSASMTFSIKKADLTESDFTVDNTNPTYAYDSTHEVAVLLPVGLDAQYVKVGYSQGGTTLTDLPKNAGTYDVSISVVGSPNYNDAFFQNKWQLVIEPKEAIVTVGALGTEEYFFNGYPHTPTVFLDLGVLPAPSTEFEGCTVTYENNTQVGTAKVIVGGNYKGEATFVIQKGKPTIGLTSPLDKVMPGYVLTLTPTTNAIDNSYYTTTFTIEDGDGYSVDGFKITIDSGVAVNDVITIKVKSTETDTYQAATGELKLTVGVPTADTSDLKAQIDDLQDQLDTLEESAKDHATQDALNGAISDLQSKLDTLNETVDAIDTSVEKNVEDILDLSEKLSTLTDEVNDLKTLVDRVDALEAADVVLQDAIDTNKGNIDNLAKELGDKYKALTDLIGTLPAEYTSVSEYVAAVEEDLNKLLKDAVDTLNTAIDTLRQDMVDKDDELQKAIEDNAANIEDLKQELTDKYNTLIDLIGVLPAEYTSVSEYVAAVNEDLTEVNATLTAAIEKLRGDMNTADSDLQKQITELGNDLTKAKNELNNAIIAGDNALSSRISSLSSSLCEAKAALEKADEENKAALEAQIKAAEETLNAAIKALGKKLDDAKAALEKADKDNKAALEKADADNKAALEAKDLELDAKDSKLTEITNDLKTFIIVVCVIASVALAGCGAFVIWFFIDRKKI